MNIIAAIGSLHQGLATGHRLLLSAAVATFAMLASPAAAMPASLERIARIAGSISSQLLGLVLVCAVVGLNMLADRRRRSRAPSSHS